MKNEIGIRKQQNELVVETGSPITILPITSIETLNSTPLHKITNKYNAVNKNEVTNKGSSNCEEQWWPAGITSNASKLTANSWHEYSV